MKNLLIITAMLFAGLVGCNDQPAEKLPEIPKELTPIYQCSHKIKHIEGHKILVFEYSNLDGRQLQILDLGKISEATP